MTDGLLAQDLAARARALDPCSSFIVQAPAGSGKTELLIQRYLRLLVTVSNPEEVLAITFTRKAAAEMLLRVSKAIENAATGNSPESDHERLTFDLAMEVLARDEELNWNLQTNPGRLRIQTLDSLNARIANMRPLTSAAATSGNRIASEAELDSLYQDAAASTLDYLTSDGVLSGITGEVLGHLDNNTFIYIRYLASMLQSRDQWLPFAGSGYTALEDSAESRTALETVLENIVVRELDRLAELVPGHLQKALLASSRFAAGKLLEAGVESEICRLAELQTMPRTSADDLPLWKGIRELLLTRDGGLRKSRGINKRIGFPPEHKDEKQVFTSLLEELAVVAELESDLDAVQYLPSSRYTNEQWQVLNALLNLLQFATVELKRLFAARGLQDHIEVAMNADQALGDEDAPGDVALLMDYSLTHILVDEMQDTSIAQYRMLTALTAGWTPDDGRTLFCVGDPMQSIYRFRNAEVAQFLLAREYGIGDIGLEPLLLRQNFRSGSVLVDWFNDVFPSVMASHSDPVRGAVPYSAAISAESLSGQGSIQVHPVYDSDESAEAQTSCKVIEQCLAKGDNESVVVLVRSRGQLRQLLPLLRRQGIAFQAVDIDRLTDLPEIIDLLALTRAAVHPADRIAWLALLRAPWIGLEWTDLHKLVVNDRHSTVLELLQDSNRFTELSEASQALITRHLPLLQSLDQTGRCASLRDRVEAAWYTLGGAALLDHPDNAENVWRYLDVLAKLESAGTLPDVAALEGQLDQERVSSIENARVQIMTMHKAKGLQFDHVILHGMGRRSANNTPEVLNWLDVASGSDREERILGPIGRRDELEKDSIHQYIMQVEKQKDSFEKQRLLYVACTRARLSLHLVGHCKVVDDELKPPEAGSLLRMLWPAVEPVFEAHLAKAGMPSGSSESADWNEPVLKRLDSGWRAPAVSLPVSNPLAESGTESQVEFYWVGAEARLAGTIAHRWFEYSGDNIAILDEQSDEFRNRTGERWLREAGISADVLERVLARVDQVISNARSDERAQWLLTGDGRSELSITGVVDGRIETGVIDRVKIDEDGNHWLVDFKTSTHEGGDLEGFLNAEEDRYRAQLAKYAELYKNLHDVPVKCALYFPLLREFRELE